MKQGSYNWYEKLKKSLVDRGFKLSDIDPGLYIGNGMIILTYVDDCIIVGPSMENINRFVDSMKNGDKNFVLTNEGDINKFLGIEITQLDDKIFKISQLYLTDRIISFLKIDANDHNIDTNENQRQLVILSYTNISQASRAKKHGTIVQPLV